MANEYSMYYGVDENGYVKTGLQGQVLKLVYKLKSTKIKKILSYFQIK